MDASPRVQQRWITRLGSKVSGWRSSPAVDKLTSSCSNNNNNSCSPSNKSAAAAGSAAAAAATPGNGYTDLHNTRMDAELFNRLRARRLMMEKLETGKAGSTPNIPKASSEATSYQRPTVTSSNRAVTSAGPTMTSRCSGSPPPGQSVSCLKRPRPRDPSHRPPRCTSASFDQLPTGSRSALDADRLQHLQMVLDRTRGDLRAAGDQLRQRNVGFEAMIVLVKYLTDKPATSKPRHNDQHHQQHLQQQLATATQQINELTIVSEFLQTELNAAKQQHEAQLRRLHLVQRTELQTAELRHNCDMCELQKLLHDALEKHDSELTELKTSNELVISQLKTEHINEMETRLDEYRQIEAELNNKIAETNKLHKKQLDEMSRRLEHAQQCLAERTSQLRRECDERRRREKMIQESTAAAAAVTSSPTAGSCTQAQHHCQQQPQQQQHKHEIDSLQAVIDMRNQELQQIRLKNRNIEKELEQLSVLRADNEKLRQKIENLEAVIDIKVDYERELAEKHRCLLRRFDAESKAMKRLSMDHEQLAWRLSQSNLDTAGSTPDVFRMLPTSPGGNATSNGGGSMVTSPVSGKLERRQRPKSMVMLSSSPAAAAGGTAGLVDSNGVKLRRPRPYAASAGVSASARNISNINIGTMRQSDV